MFRGSIPAPLRSIIYEHAGIWPGEDIYIGCSGSFTIERVTTGPGAVQKPCRRFHEEMYIA